MNNQLDCVYILMASFNGEAYIQEQINSILRQTHSNWMLYIRDDGSSDGTMAILRNFAILDGRVKLLSDSLGNLGVNSNFSELMKGCITTSAQYFCFADQDDIWHEDKLKIMLRHMKSLEVINGNDMPVLIYSDLEVVDSNLGTIASSFMDYQGLVHPTTNILERILVQNLVTGCASFFNRPLLEICAQVPPTAIVHDWWLALCASSCGLIEYLPISLVKYRQHGKNQIGAKGFVARNNPLTTQFYVRALNSRNNILNTIRQASGMISIKDNFIDDSVSQKLYMVTSIERGNFFMRIKLLRKLKLSRSHFFGSLCLNLRLLLL